MFGVMLANVIHCCVVCALICNDISNSLYYLKHPIIRSGGEAKIGDIKHHVFIYQLYDQENLVYRSFCAGSIVTEHRVLTSAHCFLTNRKRRKRNFSLIKIVAGVLSTLIRQSTSSDRQQWRDIEHLYTQRFYRFPAYNLAVLSVNNPWVFNDVVNKIPYAKWDQDFDGVCFGTAVRTTKSWSKTKSLFFVSFRLLTRRVCEQTLLRSCLLYYCTEYESYKLTSTEIEGGGLICYETGDPAEDDRKGVLVGVTSLINVGLPSLHNRIAIFNKWVTDDCARNYENKNILIVVLIVTFK